MKTVLPSVDPSVNPCAAIGISCACAAVDLARVPQIKRAQRQARSMRSRSSAARTRHRHPPSTPDRDSRRPQTIIEALESGTSWSSDVIRLLLEYARPPHLLAVHRRQSCSSTLYWAIRMWDGSRWIDCGERPGRFMRAEVLDSARLLCVTGSRKEDDAKPRFVYDAHRSSWTEAQESVSDSTSSPQPQCGTLFKKDAACLWTTAADGSRTELANWLLPDHCFCVTCRRTEVASGGRRFCYKLLACDVTLDGQTQHTVLQAMVWDWQTRQHSVSELTAEYVAAAASDGHLFLISRSACLHVWVLCRESSPEHEWRSVKLPQRVREAVQHGFLSAMCAHGDTVYWLCRDSLWQYNCADDKCEQVTRRAVPETSRWLYAV